MPKTAKTKIFVFDIRFRFVPLMKIEIDIGKLSMGNRASVSSKAITGQVYIDILWSQAKYNSSRMSGQVFSCLVACYMYQKIYTRFGETAILLKSGCVVGVSQFQQPKMSGFFKKQLVDGLVLSGIWSVILLIPTYYYCIKYPKESHEEYYSRIDPYKLTEDMMKDGAFFYFNKDGSFREDFEDTYG